MYFTKRELWFLWRRVKDLQWDTYDHSKRLIGKWYHMPRSERVAFDITKTKNQYVNHALSIPFEDIPLHLADQTGDYRLRGTDMEQIVFRWRLEIGK